MQKAVPITYREVNHIDPLPHKQLDRIYRTMLSLLVLDDVHRQYLRKEGWSDELLTQHMIRSFPERDFVRFKFSNHFSRCPYRKTLAKKVMETLNLDNLTGVPGAYQDEKGNWTFTGPKGILFPLYDQDGWLYGLRIRMDFMDVPFQLDKSKGMLSYQHDNEQFFLQPMKGFYSLLGTQKTWTKGYYQTPSQTDSKFHDVNTYFLSKQKQPIIMKL